MPRPRTHARYVVRDGREIVRFGITEDFERRAGEHDRSNMNWSSMTQVGPTVTQESAREWESTKIDRYERRNGRKPRYNKQR